MKVGSVSVIIPTYNRQIVISRAIESVLAQSLSPREVIVVDDGSTDGTADVLASFGDSIRSIRQNNQGQAVARNVGVDHASGDYVAFLDSDDWWNVDKLERQLEFFLSMNADACFHDFTLQNPATGRAVASWNHECHRMGWPVLSSDMVDDALSVVVRRADVFFTSTLLMRREVFVRLGGYRSEYRRCQDVDMHCRLALNGTVAFLDEPLAVKEENSAACPFLAYEMRLALLKQSLGVCLREGRRRSVCVLRTAIRLHLRAFAGHCRRERRLARAVCLYGEVAARMAGDRVAGSVLWRSP